MIAEVALRTVDPFPADRGEHVRGGLDRGALHEVFDTAQSAHLLAAAGPTGAAVDEVGQRRTVTGRLFGIVTVEDEHAAVPRGDLADELGGELGIVGDDGADQGTAAASGQADGILGVGIGDDRGHGPERLDVVDSIGPRVIGLEDGGRHIGTAVLGSELV